MAKSMARNLAERYKKRARKRHEYARRHFRSNELDLAIEEETIAMFLDQLILKYEKLGRSY